MKKLTVIFMLCLVLMLSACGAETEATEPAAIVSATEAAAETTIPAVETTEPAPTENPLRQTAMEYVDMDVQDLVAAIGEPLEWTYAPSCLGDGEDGNLVYDGFLVFTYKDETGEVVTLVD